MSAGATSYSAISGMQQMMSSNERIPDVHSEAPQDYQSNGRERHSDQVLIAEPNIGEERQPQSERDERQVDQFRGSF